MLLSLNDPQLQSTLDQAAQRTTRRVKELNGSTSQLFFKNIDDSIIRGNSMSKSAATARQPSGQLPKFIRNDVADRLDLRDCTRQLAYTAQAEAGGIKLYQACQKLPYFKDKSKVRLHFIGHSAGSILHSRLIERLSEQGWCFDSVNFMAPAVRVDTFADKVVPAIKNGRVKRYHQFHLTDATEQKDPSYKPILGSSRSLLYLVSQSFEQGKVTPILGMEKYFDAKLQALPNVRACAAPCKESQSVEHGGFDDDKATRGSVVALNMGKELREAV